MMIRLNYLINLLNLSLILIYFIFINIELVKKEFEYLLISLIIINLSIKLYNWNITTKKDLHTTLKYYFFNVRLTRLSIIIFSIVTPLYMIVQKDSLVIDLFIEKLSFLLVFIFSLVGFYLEFFILERKSNK
tara:strand:- start:43 stop:438 length:396 start_codon:yes stop_codon:yes gene_type:complete